MSGEGEANQAGATQTPFKYEVTSEKSVVIDFSGNEENDASIFTVELPTENDAVKAPEGEVKVFIVTKGEEKNEICSFSPEDTNEKEVQFTATKEDEPTILVEGPGTVIVSGVFSKEEDFSDEEEEEEENAEAKQ